MFIDVQSYEGLKDISKSENEIDPSITSGQGMKKKTRVRVSALALTLTLVFCTSYDCILEPNQVRFFIIEYKIRESSSASFNILSRSDSDILLSSLRISRTATHSNTEALEVVK